MSLENAIIDTHIDTPYRLYKQQMEPARLKISPKNQHHFDLPRALEGGLNVPFFAIYVPAVDETNGVAFDTANKVIDFMNALSKKTIAFFILLDLRRISIKYFNKKVGIAYGMENGGPLKENLNDFSILPIKASVTSPLTHSKSNHISDSSYDETRQWNGLSPLGLKL